MRASERLPTGLHHCARTAAQKLLRTSAGTSTGYTSMATTAKNSKSAAATLNYWRANFMRKSLQVLLPSLLFLAQGTWAHGQNLQGPTAPAADSGSASEETERQDERREMRNEIRALREEVERLRAEVEQQKGGAPAKAVPAANGAAPSGAVA